MKISDLIARLDAIKAEHGDLEIYSSNEIFDSEHVRAALRVPKVIQAKRNPQRPYVISDEDAAHILEGPASPGKSRCQGVDSVGADHHVRHHLTE